MCSRSATGVLATVLPGAPSDTAYTSFSPVVVPDEPSRSITTPRPGA